MSVTITQNYNDEKIKAPGIFLGLKSMSFFLMFLIFERSQMWSGLPPGKKVWLNN